MKKRTLWMAMAGVCAACGAEDPTDLGDASDTGGSDTAVSDADASLDVQVENDADTVCTPACGEAECGDDGCGGTCGGCDAGEECVEGACEEAAGGDSCVDIIACINTNRCQDQACINECVAPGTAEAQAQIADVFNCLADNCQDATTDSEFAACQQEFCSDELATCQGIEPPPTPSGDDTCEEVVDCMTSCLTLTSAPAQQQCVNDCSVDGTVETSAEALAGLQCVATAACAESIRSIDDFFACFESGCPDEYAACYDIAEPTPCEAFCTAVDENCTGGDAAYEDTAACAAACAEFPTDGTGGDADGDTLQCRAYHAGEAAADPGTHCPAAAADGGDVCVAEEPASLCAQYCDAVLANCTGDAAPFGTESACLEACGAYPTAGAEGDLAGNSVHCRLAHALAAAEDAATHCTSAGVEGGSACIDLP